MKACIIGLGYIGFPTACVLSSAGLEVVGVDVNSDLITKLRNGGLHIVNENGLADLAHTAIESGHLRVSEEPEPADVFMIAVPTPLKLATYPIASGDPCESGVAAHEAPGCSEFPVADLTHVEEATRLIAPFVKKGDLIILESTVPPGTTREVVCRTLESTTGLQSSKDLFIIHAPERVLPGNIVYELVHNDRIVGGVTPEATKVGVAFYRKFVHGNVIGTDATTAELVKLMENTFRDVNIALANEFAMICERLGINVFDAIKLANRHPRVTFLSPGPGVGGHCIPIDPNFVIQAASRESQLIGLARKINSDMPCHVIRLFDELARESQRAGWAVSTVGVLGASYKANVGDNRESPALEVADILSNRGYKVIIHDPYVRYFNEIPLANVVSSADILVLFTDHEFYRKELTPDVVNQFAKDRKPLILDTRGFFDRTWDESGFYVKRLGVGVTRKC
jgi:UDP-N-acetyl-D-mannosaminuronic acid dehydrogenase